MIVYKLDRIGRRVSEVSEYFEQLADKRVLLISATEGVFDLTDPNRMQFALFLAVQAQGESANTSIRVRNDRAERKAKGAWLGGPAPYGWEVDVDVAANGDKIFNRTENGLKRLRLNQAEAPVLKKIVDWVTVDRMSTIAAVRRANEEGLRDRTGKEFRYNHVRSLLRNPVLFGGVPEVDYDPATGHAIERSMRPSVDAHGVPHKINEALISFNEWQHLQALTGQTATWVANRSGQAPLLGALIVCGGGPAAPDGSKQPGGCGQRMYGSGDPHDKNAYVCRVSTQNRNRCAGNTIIQVAVENWVTAVFLGLLAQPEFAQRHAAMVAKALDDGEERAGKLLARLRELQDDLKDWEAAARTKTGRAGLVAVERVEELEAQIAELHTELNQGRVTPESLEAFIGRDPREIWDTATQGQRAAWLATVFSRVEILPAVSGHGAEKGGFGSRGLDPRRVRLYTHHDPKNPIVVADDYQRAAPDLGGPVACPDCGKELKNWAGLAAHRRWTHGVVSEKKAARGETATEHRCYKADCDAVFFTEVPLRNHLYNAHGITQGYPCPHCDRTFALPAHLGRHLGTHRDEKDACDLCGKIVKKGGVGLHKARAHGGTGRR